MSYRFITSGSIPSSIALDTIVLYTGGSTIQAYYKMDNEIHNTLVTVRVGDSVWDCDKCLGINSYSRLSLFPGVGNSNYLYIDTSNGILYGYHNSNYYKIARYEKCAPLSLAYAKLTVVGVPSEDEHFTLTDDAGVSHNYEYDYDSISGAANKIEIRPGDTLADMLPRIRDAINGVECFGITNTKHFRAVIVDDHLRIMQLSNGEFQNNNNNSNNSEYTVLTGFSGGLTSGGGGDNFGPWVTITANTNAVAGDNLSADTSSSSFSVTLPGSPNNDVIIAIVDQEGTFDTNNLIIVANGNLINGVSGNITCDIKYNSVTLKFIGGLTGWELYS